MIYAKNVNEYIKKFEIIFREFKTSIREILDPKKYENEVMNLVNILELDVGKIKLSDIEKIVKQSGIYEESKEVLGDLDITYKVALCDESIEEYIKENNELFLNDNSLLGIVIYDDERSNIRNKIENLFYSNWLSKKIFSLLSQSFFRPAYFIKNKEEREIAILGSILYTIDKTKEVIKLNQFLIQEDVRYKALHNSNLHNKIWGVSLKPKDITIHKHDVYEGTPIYLINE